MYKTLVTGGAGFIGSHVAEHLVKRGQEVVVLDDLSGGFLDNVPSGAHFVKGSITDTALVNELFRTYRFAFVYHLAAYAAENLSHYIKRYNYDNNLIGSINLINASINYDVRCFVFTSSIAVYGATRSLPVTEATEPHPEDSYGIAKLAVERELEICKDMFGLNFVVFRPHNVYGERQNIADKYRNVVGIFMNQILQKQPMTIFGDGSQVRAFSHISEVAPVIAEAAFNTHAYNHIFNIGADRPCSVRDLADAVARAMGVETRVLNLPARREVRHIYASHEKVRRVFGSVRTVSLEEGLGRMASWVKQHGARMSQEFGGIEVTKSFPASWL